MVPEKAAVVMDERSNDEVAQLEHIVECHQLDEGDGLSQQNGRSPLVHDLLVDVRLPVSDVGLVRLDLWEARRRQETGVVVEQAPLLAPERGVD